MTTLKLKMLSCHLGVSRQKDKKDLRAVKSYCGDYMYGDRRTQEQQQAYFIP